jgi:hypothetical protein
MIDEWMSKHAAFLKPVDDYRPVELRRRALVAIDAGGPDGAPLGDVHRAIKSAHLPAKVIHLMVDRLVADGHVHREVIQTGGRPRTQLWSFRHAPEAVRDDMAYTGVWAAHGYGRMRWAGKDREAIVIEVLGAVGGASLSLSGIEAAAGQLYVDAGRGLVGALYRGKKLSLLKPGKVKAELRKMALYRLIRENEFGDEFSIR